MAATAALASSHPWSSDTNPTNEVTRSQSASPGEPPIRYARPANASGLLEDNVTRFGPPQHLTSAIPPREALHDAWLNRSFTDAVGTRLVLVRLQSATYQVPRDVWLVVFYGHQVIPKVPQPHWRQRSGHATPITEVIDALTGKPLFTFAGGNPRDPMRILLGRNRETSVNLKARDSAAPAAT